MPGGNDRARELLHRIRNRKKKLGLLPPVIVVFLALISGAFRDARRRGSASRLLSGTESRYWSCFVRG